MTKFLPAGLIVAGLVAANSAGAFTYDNRTNQNPDGTARFTDPNSPSAAANAARKSRFSIQFSGGSGGQRGYSSDRFLPTANGAFTSPFAGPSNLDTALGYNRRN